eukprot:1976406-Pyramimonas_sp.AAC.1
MDPMEYLRSARLQRHAASNFHVAAVAAFIGSSQGLHPRAPSKADFKKVVDHVVRVGGAMASG